VSLKKNDPVSWVISTTTAVTFMIDTSHDKLLPLTFQMPTRGRETRPEVDESARRGHNAANWTVAITN